MNALVLLAHRIPFPPDKGDKIRSFHLLQFLSRHYRVHLGAFVDHPDDWKHAAALQAWCEGLHLEPLPRWSSRLRALAGLLGHQPVTLPYYASTGMRQWLARTVAQTGARRLVAFSAAMAQYADEFPADTHRVLDLVDVDSEKWRAYGERRGGPAGWLFRREGERLLGYERAAAARFDATTLVSPAEAGLFRRLCPEAADRVRAIGNGVDTDYFAPDPARRNPYGSGVLPVVFTGAMDYWPNVDAVTWFATEILPAIRKRNRRVCLYVVGARPTRSVRALESLNGVRVVGRVPDMRPWLQHAGAAVAPLRIARGIQNKVLEAFAMARPVVVTPAALDGVDAGTDYPFCGETPEQLAELTLAALNEEAGGAVGRRMREHVVQKYGWESRLAGILGLIESTPGSREALAPAGVPA